MVPHTRILAAIALAARSSGDETHLRDVLCRLHRVQFPATLLGERAFWLTAVLDALPIELQVSLETSQPNLTGDFTAMFEAAKVLGLDGYVQVGQTITTDVSANSPFVNVAPSILDWRQHNAIRLALESMMLCNVPVGVVAEDMRKMYGHTFEEDYLVEFKSLYADREKMRDWGVYARCIPQEELAFKHRLVSEPLDFVRWKLGVPVHLDNDMVLDRLMSEAYYTERMIKNDARSSDPHGLPLLGAADLNRLKLERDTVFKCLDRKIKLRELSAQQSSATNTLHKEMAALKLDYTQQVMPLASELTDG